MATKEEIRERLKVLSEEDVKLFREALQEDSPEEKLSGEEVSEIREMLQGIKTRKAKKGGLTAFLDDLDSLLK
jgi:hypothetical protein